MSVNHTDDKSTLVQVMAWCRQATSHYLSQCWPRSLTPYGITRPQWVNTGPHCMSVLIEVMAWCCQARSHYFKQCCTGTMFPYGITGPQGDFFINTLRLRQNGRHFTDDNFKCIFLNENVRISIEISLKFFPKGRINYIPSLVQIMAWRRPGDKPLSEPMMVRLPMHICVARSQWVKCMS